NRGEIGLQTDFASLKTPPSEIECINSRYGGCCADLPYGVGQEAFHSEALVLVRSSIFVCDPSDNLSSCFYSLVLSSPPLS
ncbi:hypothetical protein, partial [Caldimonas sp.]|uniref:hypothetical protein n=1 Tax=Caldimonas sp. TaxID=2838790 RepID=UPI003918EC12